jgi:two-component system sensor histidine kinase UhpB
MTPSPSSHLFPHRTRVSLFAQVLGVNTVIIVATVFVASVIAQFDLSTQTGMESFLVAVVAILATVLVNGLVLRRRFAPLEELISSIDDVDLERPRLHTKLQPGEPDDIAQLRHAVEGMLSRLDEERRRRASAVIAAQETERARLARDLHDEVNQSLTGILLRLTAIGADADPTTRHRLKETRDLTQAAMLELLRLSHDLRPTALDDLGLSAAIGERLRTLARDSGLQVSLDVGADLPVLGGDRETVLFRVVQEALSNVVQHADASKVNVSLQARADDGVLLTIADDGSGFDPAAFRPGDEHAGLTGMNERALMSGGVLRLDSGATGTTVELEL